MLFIGLNSCQYFYKPPPSKAELLKKELNSINWNEVDEYPSVAECDKIEDKTQRQQCFFDYLGHAIQEKLQGDTITMLYPELDTIEVKVTVFANATLQFEPQFPKENTTYNTLKIDSILAAKLVDFPKINPALKRGIPVKTEFILPVILKMN